MPNWTYNKIYTKTEEDLQKIKDAFSRETDYGGTILDFNKIIPMPKSIELTQSPSYGLKDRETIHVIAQTPAVHDKAIKAIEERYNKFTDEQKKQLEEEKKKWLGYNESFQKYCEEFKKEPTAETYIKQTMYNEIMYGSPDWYTWSIDHWDTKWNASNVDWGDNIICFTTAWSPAIKIVKELTKQLNIEIFYLWSEEQFSEYGGYMHLKGGEIITEEEPESGSKEMFILASNLQDPDQDFFRYDEEQGQIVSEWDFEKESETHFGKYKDFEDVPKINITIDELEEFFDN